MRFKRIYLNVKNTKYCTLKLYGSEKEMQAAYKKRKPDDTGHEYVAGASVHHERYYVPSMKLHPETGIVFLSVENCKAGLVSHELLHAVLWAHKHKKNKKQYPLIIKDMNEEETILRNHTYAVDQFYAWYWKVVEQTKK